MTIGQYLNKNHPDFRRWGFLVNWYSFLYKTTGLNKWRIKSAEYLEKRWNAMMDLMDP